MQDLLSDVLRSRAPAQTPLSELMGALTEVLKTRTLGVPVALSGMFAQAREHHSGMHASAQVCPILCPACIDVFAK